ncbi:hypothetical protein GCM10007897_33810 [Sphingobium jiangsuense]|uniref:Uncharacterized protein n=1 Tax=Sphingobium jiangsuense TaxID=870476 RepID=A0A7W6BEA8_9SPHN|nr:hypothetical protein [Sphingobium jiangsuense]MBB3924529.1 hypothetical protein [Sphingobium jiangsuense]GLT01979.1 hypothetical protein GCM10007897_33810 [Sphingobium jiangsuense]
MGLNAGGKWGCIVAAVVALPLLAGAFLLLPDQEGDGGRLLAACAGIVLVAGLIGLAVRAGHGFAARRRSERRR